METSRQQQWQVIMQMTETLQQLLVNEDWPALTDLSAQRQTELSRFFSVDVSNDEAEEIADGIRLIMQRDERVIQVSRHQQQVLVASIKKNVMGTQAVQAYDKIQQS